MTPPRRADCRALPGTCTAAHGSRVTGLPCPRRKEAEMKRSSSFRRSQGLDSLHPYPKAPAATSSTGAWVRRLGRGCCVLAPGCDLLPHPSLHAHVPVHAQSDRIATPGPGYHQFQKPPTQPRPALAFVQTSFDQSAPFCLPKTTPLCFDHPHPTAPSFFTLCSCDSSVADLSRL